VLGRRVVADTFAMAKSVRRRRGQAPWGSPAAPSARPPEMALMLLRTTWTATAPATWRSSLASMWTGTALRAPGHAL